MKKSNVTFIATVLIALHALAFALLLGNCSDRKVPKPPSPPQPETEAPAPVPDDEFKMPEMGLFETDTLPDAPAPAQETIARPGSRKGYLRNDLASRRTSTVFGELVGNPYTGAIVVDARTGRILYENRSTSYCYPASVTKLMTMLIVLDQVKAGVINLNDKVAITKEGTGVGGSQAYFDVRESGAFTVDDMLNALMIHSANDAARVLGIHVAGSKAAFVDMMNQKARELGMNATTYHSEHGLPPGKGKQPDISTPHDIALLCIAALRHPDTLRYTGTKLTYLPKGPIRPEKFMLANRNALVGRDPYPGCDGLKTGYHSIGGWSLAATAERNGQRVIAIALGCPDKATRNDTVKKLLDRGFSALSK